MRKSIYLAALLLVTAPAAAQAPLGAFFRWAAFEQARPHTCYAITAASAPRARREGQPYASVAIRPERRLRPQLYLRLSGRKRPGSAILLRIDGTLFQLVGEEANAWAPSAAADAAIVAAMRTGVRMAVETRSEGGRRIRDLYVLRGAASAIDAAAFACAADASRQR